MVDFELEVKALKEEIDKLRSANDMLKQIIVTNDLEEEIDESISLLSVEEKMCREGMDHLSKLYEIGSFDLKDTQNFKILFDILQGIRGKDPVKTKKTKKANIAELINIAKGS